MLLLKTLLVVAILGSLIAAILTAGYNTKPRQN